MMESKRCASAHIWIETDGHVRERKFGQKNDKVNGKMRNAEKKTTKFECSFKCNSHVTHNFQRNWMLQGSSFFFQQIHFHSQCLLSFCMIY